LLEFFALAAASAIDKALLHRHVLERQRIEYQLRIARDVQSSLLPGGSPAVPGYDLAGINLPTWEIGGDYFDYLPLADGLLGVVIADVSGKGIGAALLMATFRAALRAGLLGERDVRQGRGTRRSGATRLDGCVALRHRRVRALHRRRVGSPT